MAPLQHQTWRHGRSMVDTDTWPTTTNPVPTTATEPEEIKWDAKCNQTLRNNNRYCTTYQHSRTPNSANNSEIQHQPQCHGRYQHNTSTADDHCQIQKVKFGQQFAMYSLLSFAKWNLWANWWRLRSISATLYKIRLVSISWVSTNYRELHDWFQLQQHCLVSWKCYGKRRANDRFELDSWKDPNDGTWSLMLTPIDTH